MNNIIIGIIIVLVGAYFIYSGFTYKAKANSIKSIKPRLIIAGIIGCITGLYLIFT